MLNSWQTGGADMDRLPRKVDKFLDDWKAQDDRQPLVIKGARQIGKTKAIEFFASRHYKSVVEINFVLQKQYKGIFDDGFEVEQIIRNISLINPNFEFPAGETLFFFDGSWVRQLGIAKTNPPSLYKRTDCDVKIADISQTMHFSNFNQFK